MPAGALYLLSSTILVGTKKIFPDPDPDITCTEYGVGGKQQQKIRHNRAGFLRDKVNWKLTDIKNNRQTMFVLLNIKDDKLRHNFSIKIEIHKPAHKVDIEYNLVDLQSSTSIFQPLLLVPTLEELKNLKILTIQNRKKARDIFDLWYISQKLREQFVCPQVVKYKKREFKNGLQVFLSKDYYFLIEQLYTKVYLDINIIRSVMLKKYRIARASFSSSILFKHYSHYTCL